MKRANIQANGQSYKGYFIIENMEDLMDFFEEKHYGMVKDVVKELVERLRNNQMGHSTNQIVGTIEEVTKLTGEGVLYYACELMGKYQTNLIMHVANGDKIAINSYNGIGYFPLLGDATYEIVSEKEAYTADDIRVMKFDGGIHWYAKIGQIDVVIDGEQKWNVKWEAQQKAEQYLKEKLN